MITDSVLQHTSSYKKMADPATTTTSPTSSPPPAPATTTAAAAVTPAVETAAPEEKKLSKNALKKLQRAEKDPKPKKEKDPNRWAPKKDKENKKKEAKPAVETPAFVNTTPKGEKKDMAAPMAAAYNPVAVESAWQDWWEKSGFFACSDDKIKNAKPDERFVMVIPPPNVTGSLHLGHALTVAIQDALTRWHRMLGHATLWVPGTDHAGIATQSVVEKRLMKDENLSRHELGREEFLKRVWEWKNQYESRIHHQFRSVGCSVDWERAYFSMDGNCSRAVRHAFCKLWEDKLIYRATRMINWSCRLKTALSEIEVDYIDIEKRTKMAVPGHNPDRKYEFGVLTSFGYQVEGSDEQIIVATTRLETMLGDSGVAVHPEDPRYTHLHGKFVIHPFNGRRIPIVLDPVLVDMSFGTGAVKITPAHDPNDYECGKRNNLEFINVLTDDGAINENGGEFAGMMRYDARIEIEKALAAKNLYHGKTDNKMRLGICSRSGDIIEPLVKPQWFINCDQMAKDAMTAVTNKDLTILPESHEKTWFRWLENIRDWCISRQLWWGHRIPAYFARVQGEKWADPNSEENADRWVAGISEEDARMKAALKLGVAEDQVILEQDEDVLDTWVSAGLFPFAVFGWPEKSIDFDNFYPTDLMETGYDILFFWVARMVFMGQKLTGKLPFHTVYLHSMVRDKYGRKMSKSLGNVIDPLEIISGCTLEELFAKLESGNLPQKEVEKAKKGQQMDFPNGIPECGADALRFGLLAYTQQGRDINLDINRLVGYRNFCNKLWNATRFAMTNLEGGFVGDDATAATVLTRNKVVSARDRYILSRLNHTIEVANKAFAAYEFGDLTNALYNFWLYDLCDVYLELAKPVFAGDDAEAKTTAQQVLYICLEYGLRLLHPMMPFVTEELWQRLPGKHATASITIVSYPLPVDGWRNPEAEANMELVKEVIHAARSVRAEYGLVNSVRPQFYVKCSDDDVKRVIDAQLDDFGTLAKAGESHVLVDEEPPKGCAMHSVNEKIQIHVLLAGLVDFANEIAKLEKKMSRIAASIDSLQKKIAKEDYTTKVPESVRETEAAKLEALTKEKEGIENAIAGFQRLL
ncbi:Valine-trna ligase, partial [Globisporangium splendens]